MRRALFALAPIIVIAIAVIAVTWGHPAAETTHAGFLDPTMSLVVKTGSSGGVWTRVCRPRRSA